MKLAIFGATGATGRELVQQALDAGHSLTCLVREPAVAKLPAKVKQVQGDVRDAAAVERVIQGSDAVLSALGSRSLKKSDLLDRAMVNILGGMKKAGVRRLVVLGAAGARYDAEKLQTRRTKFFFSILRRTLLKYPFEDQEAQEQRLEASDVDYTIVRPPRLTNGPHTGRYRVEEDGLPKAQKSIARADVADFMLRQISDPRSLRRGIYIAR